MKRLVKLLFAFVALFAPLSAFAADFVPGIAAGAIIQNPTVQRIMEVGAWFILVIFACVLLKNIFTFVTGAGKPNWFTIIGKFLIIFFLYNNAVWVVTEFVNKVIIQTNISDTEQLSESFSKLDVALMTIVMGDPEQLTKEKEKARSNSILPDALSDALVDFGRLYSPQTLVVAAFSILMKGLLTVAMITKILMIDIFWPIFFQLTIIGFVFAVPFASFDGGMDAIKKFAINVVEVAMWPVIYNIAFVLCTNELVNTINKFVKVVYDIDTSNIGYFAYAAGAAKILADLPLCATLAAQLLFIVFLGLLVPMFSRMIVRNESVGIAASAVTYSVGQGLLKGAAAIGGAAGAAMMNAGKGIAGMSGIGTMENPGTKAAIGPIMTRGKDGSWQMTESGGAGNSGSSSANGGGSSKVAGNLSSEGNKSTGSGGRAAHDGKAFYNLPNLTKEENQAFLDLQKNAPSQSYIEAAKDQFGKLQGMRKDNYHPNAIQNQIEHINKQFGTNLNSGKKEGDNK